MKRKEIFALIIAGILIVPAIIFLYLGLLNLIDIAVAYLSASAFAIAAVLVWGFKDRIFSKLGESNSNAKPVDSKKPPKDDDGYIVGNENKGYKSRTRKELRDIDDFD